MSNTKRQIANLKSNIQGYKVLIAIHEKKKDQQQVDFYQGLIDNAESQINELENNEETTNSLDATSILPKQ